MRVLVSTDITGLPAGEHTIVIYTEEVVRQFDSFHMSCVGATGRQLSASGGNSDSLELRNIGDQVVLRSESVKCDSVFSAIQFAYSLHIRVREYIGTTYTIVT